MPDSPLGFFGQAGTSAPDRAPFIPPDISMSGFVLVVAITHGFMVKVSRFEVTFNYRGMTLCPCTLVLSVL